MPPERLGMAKANRLQQNPPFGKGRDSPSDSQRSVTAPPLLLEKHHARCFGLELNRSKRQQVFECKAAGADLGPYLVI